MPIFEYRIVEQGSSEPGCEHCRQGFDHLEKLNAEPLTVCPLCGTPVQRVISAPNLAIGTAHVLKDGHAAKHGFTQYRKVGKGKYEKAFGKGPDNISSD